MPLYEYHCQACDEVIEVLVRGDAERPACPHCEGGRLTRLLSVPAAHTQGSGGEEPPAGPCGSACGCFPPA